MPAPVLPANLTHLAHWLNELEDRVSAVEQPGSPRPDFACLKADLPSAAGENTNRRAYVTDTKILVVSDGTVWRRQDTGVAI